VIRAAALVALLSACSAPSVKYSLIDGVEVIEHIDMIDNPCGNRGIAAGCYWVTPRRVAGGQFAVVHHVAYSSVAPAYVRLHELAHVKGMRHDDWRFNSWHKETCARITAGIVGYPAGSVICVDGKRERVFNLIGESDNENRN